MIALWEWHGKSRNLLLKIEIWKRKSEWESSVQREKIPQDFLRAKQWVKEEKKFIFDVIESVFVNLRRGDP